MLKKGDRIVFGSYPGDADGNKKPVLWRVLDVKGYEALIIANMGLDALSYDDYYFNAAWETCTLRKCLNSTIFDKMFNDSEMQIIKETELQNPGGNTTRDRLFPLSADEAKTYFKSYEDRACKASEWAGKNNAATFKGSCHWWLRSSGRDADSAAYVNEKGNIVLNGRCTDDDTCCVRPACYINICDPESGVFKLVKGWFEEQAGNEYNNEYFREGIKELYYSIEKAWGKADSLIESGYRDDRIDEIRDLLSEAYENARRIMNGE